MSARRVRRAGRSPSPDSDCDCFPKELESIRKTSLVICTQPATEPEITLDFSKPWKMSDLVLSVEGKKLHVHKAILAISSPVFEAMLSSNFKEKNANEIPLPGKKVEETEGLLRAIYPYCKHAITRQNCFSLLGLSCEYQMDELKERCEKFVLDTYRPPGTIKTLRNEALQLVVMSQRHQLSEEVVQRCITTFVSDESRWESLKTNELFAQLEPQNSQRIMEERVKFLENRLDTCSCGKGLSSPAFSVSPTWETTFGKRQKVSWVTGSPAF